MKWLIRLYSYKFNTLPNIDALRDDCKNWLITILNKFDPDKGSKAFTYFSVVSKNWFIAQVKKTSKKSKKKFILTTSTWIEQMKIEPTITMKKA